MKQIVVQRRVAPLGIPAAASIRLWAKAAVDGAKGELTIRIVDQAESQSLNAQYRGIDKPTNVLSFPYDHELMQAELLGDIVICAPVVLREAAQQQKSPRAHWAHMVVHGCLHILGYDHLQDEEANAMESRERSILNALGFEDPYINEQR